MKIRKRMAERRLTDRSLADEAGVSTTTVYNAKRGKVSRWKPMELIAAALDCEVEDVDEFRSVLRERILREAERQGAPSEVLDKADQMDELDKVFHIMLPPSDEDVYIAAYFLLRDTVSYLDEVGRGDLVDEVVRQRRGG